MTKRHCSLVAPISGQIVSLEGVPDPVFAEKMTGEIVLRAYNQGAEYITSTDIHCLQLLDAYKQQHDVDIDIIHIADILRGEE